MSYKGRSYRRTFCLNFQILFSRNFLYFHIFLFFSSKCWNAKPSKYFALLNFQTLELFPVFPTFPVFLGKKRGKSGKSCSIRTVYFSAFPVFLGKKKENLDFFFDRKHFQITALNKHETWHSCTYYAHYLVLLLLLCALLYILLLLLQLPLLAAAVRHHRVPDGKICCWFIESLNLVPVLSLSSFKHLKKKKTLAVMLSHLPPRSAYT